MMKIYKKKKRKKKEKKRWKVYETTIAKGILFFISLFLLFVIREYITKYTKRNKKN